MAIDRERLKAAIGPKAEYYLRRFERIDAGRKAGWNWPAFFLSTAWFSYRGLGGWAAVNLLAPWLGLILFGFTGEVVANLATLVVLAYLVGFFFLVPIFADELYYRRLKKEIAREAQPGKRPASPTRPFSAALTGFMAMALPVLLLLIVQSSYVDYTPRAQVGEAISLMGGAKTPIAEYLADKGKWPDNLSQVAGNTSGRYTERVEITSGAGAGSGPLVMTATMRKDGVRSAVAGKTVQMRSEDEGKTWTCTRGAVNGVEDKYLPAACR